MGLLKCMLWRLENGICKGLSSNTYRTNRNGRKKKMHFMSRKLGFRRLYLPERMERIGGEKYLWSMAVSLGVCTLSLSLGIFGPPYPISSSFLYKKQGRVEKPFYSISFFFFFCRDFFRGNIEPSTFATRFLSCRDIGRLSFLCDFLVLVDHR